MTKPRARVTEYTVDVLDVEHADWGLFQLTVSWRGGDRWAVVHGGHRCLGTDGGWSWESSPSNREDDWKETHRFGLEEALERAEWWVWKWTTNGRTAAQMIREYYPDLVERIPEHAE